MNLIKTSALSFVATSVKLLAALIINKAVAVFIGPAGLAVIGQLQNFIQMVSIAAQGGFNQGIVKYTAEYNNDKHQLRSLLSAAASYSVLTALIVSVVLYSFNSAISDFIFGTRAYSYVIIVMAVTLIFYVANNFLLSILNGLKEIKTYILINITQSILSLILTIFLIQVYGLDGALISLVTSQSLVFLVILLLLKDHRVFHLFRLTRRLNKGELVRLSSFSLMALTSCICVPLSHMAIRQYIANRISWEAAGNWQALWYISSAYIMVVTVTLSTYYLPRLSELRFYKDIRDEIFRSFSLILPMAVGSAIFIFLSRDLVVSLLFTSEFESIKSVLKYQLVGDVVKIASWSLGFLTVAKGMTKAFIILEVTGSLSFLGLSILFISHYGFVGVTYAYVLNYMLYIIILIFIFRKLLFNQFSENEKL